MARILLVDDDAELVARNTAALEADGHAVATASTTAQGLEAGRRGAPARTLARECPALPLIMLSRVDEVIPARVLEAQDRDDGWLPVARFMEKPVAPEVLVYEVDHLLPVAHGAAGAAPTGR
jgi:DNA-binding response OmpR family regulator